MPEWSSYEPWREPHKIEYLHPEERQFGSGEYLPAEDCAKFGHPYHGYFIAEGNAAPALR